MVTRKFLYYDAPPAAEPVAGGTHFGMHIYDKDGEIVEGSTDTNMPIVWSNGQDDYICPGIPITCATSPVACADATWPDRFWITVYRQRISGVWVDMPESKWIDIPLERVDNLNGYPFGYWPVNPYSEINTFGDMWMYFYASRDESECTAFPIRKPYTSAQGATDCIFYVDIPLCRIIRYVFLLQRSSVTPPLPWAPWIVAGSCNQLYTSPATFNSCDPIELVRLDQVNCTPFISTASYWTAALPKDSP